MPRSTYIAILFCWAMAAQGEQPPVCQAVSTDQITGRDMAAILPQFAVLAPDLKLGYAPAPGAQRVFSALQLKKLAEKSGVQASITEPVCFEWSMRPLSQQQIVIAMRKSLPERNITLELTNQSRSLAPEGELKFPLQGFTGESANPSTWNGFVVYAGGRKFSTWAQVRITVDEKHVIAARPISTGETIGLSDLKIVDYRGPLRHVPVFQDESEVAGKCARWFISAGTVLARNMLVPKRDVEKEQLVTVHIDSGAAHIETQGIASDEGYVGSVIRVRNPKTGRVFRARIEDHGVVRVVPGGTVGLVVEDRKS